LRPAVHWSHTLKLGALVAQAGELVRKRVLVKHQMHARVVFKNCACTTPQGQTHEGLEHQLPPEVHTCAVYGSASRCEAPLVIQQHTANLDGLFRTWMNCFARLSSGWLLSMSAMDLHWDEVAAHRHTVSTGVGGNVQCLQHSCMGCGQYLLLDHSKCEVLWRTDESLRHALSRSSSCSYAPVIFQIFRLH
jgi:hypothetical protein